ncbi:MAG: hypothetical protein E5Y10_26505 [Mesorhizobium sp.]|nr:MAG: hypothetical protein EOS13_15435 [Mesorhizobium sp.]TIN22670.1 MAG: hypothetical protein E5Y19_31405 [Mesorhizobium sp.]TIN35405.1 MAG: hypothetical protein E5Y13_27690 [Mesorhizobium sp.]TJU79041.1 MAG: hypothetical protein E5Y15_24940 [Mesorhizobium sp.]TJU84993.1 MAG: hypothetical protein E5Y10_26505 [Mesorhizobium sp.]
MLSRRPNSQRSTPVSEPTVAEATDSIYASLRLDVRLRQDCHNSVTRRQLPTVRTWRTEATQHFPL